MIIIEACKSFEKIRKDRILFWNTIITYQIWCTNSSIIQILNLKGAFTNYQLQIVKEYC